MTVQLGQNVTYISAKGQKKAALVIGTPDTIEEGTSVPQPEEFELNLLVISPTGSVYAKAKVPPVSETQETQAYIV